MKNLPLVTQRVEAESQPHNLEKRRGDLLFDAFTFGNEAHNGSRSADMALKCIEGRLRPYRDYYQSLAKQADSVGMVNEAYTFRETAQLFSPWKDEDEFLDDRKAYDTLKIEVELLSLEGTSADVIYSIYESGEEE